MNLDQIMLYLCQKSGKGLSKARLAKMIYLSDWKSSIDHGRQISDVTWLFDHYGPYSEKVIKTARESDLFSIDSFKNNGDLIFAKSGLKEPQLSQQNKDIFDFVINDTITMKYDDFIKQVYSTYPIVSQPRYTNLDLVKLAEQYKRIRNLLQ